MNRAPADLASNAHPKSNCQPACKPGSVRGCPRDDHSSGTPIAERLLQPTRAAAWKPARPHLSAKPVPPLFGLAPGGVCPAAPVASRAVRSYRTLSPLLRTDPQRFAFCGTFPGVAPAGRYPAPCLHGARTFLCGEAAVIRPTGVSIRGEGAAGVKQPWRGYPLCGKIYEQIPLLACF
jgi:hypothetical protein